MKIKLSKPFQTYTLEAFTDLKRFEAFEATVKIGNPIEYLDILYYLGYLPVERRGTGAGCVGGGEAGAGVGGVGGDGGGEGLEHAQYEAHLPDHHVQYSTVQYSTVQYTVLSTVPDHHVGLGLGREGVEARHQTLDLVRHAVQLARGRLYSRDTLLEIGNANGIGIFLEVNKIIITRIVFDSSLLHIILLKI